VKRCVQCQNELPDTAAHCVFCGAKQPVVSAATAAAANARTVMGYPSELARQSGTAPPPAGPIGKPGRPGAVGPGHQVSGFDATQPLANEGFRGGPGPGFGPPPAGGAGPGFGPPPASGAGPGARVPPPPGYPPPQPPAFGPGPPSHAPQPPLHSYGPPHQQQPLHSYGPPPLPPPQHNYGPPPGQGFGPGPGGPGAGPGSHPQHPQGFGPPSDPAFVSPGPPPGYPQPKGGFGPEPHVYGPPPSGSGFNPVYGQPHVYGPPPMGFHRPETDMVPPLRAPYLAMDGRRMSSPMEPWAESLKTLMLVFGVLLVACFVAPWRVQPGETTFAWTILGSEAPAALKVVPVLFLATGVLAVVLGALPLAALARGFAAAGIGLAPIVYLSVAPAFEWRELLGLIGAVTLVSGLLVRSHYTGALIGRLMATIGAVCVLLPHLIPIGGDTVPLVARLQMIADAPFEGKLEGIVALVPALLAVVAFLVWLPAPGRAGAHILAWLLIVWPLVGAIAVWLAHGDLGATLKDSLNAVLYMPLAAMAWAALTGYGVATVAGKQLEQT
jgi:hypothetical protein